MQLLGLLIHLKTMVTQRIDVSQKRRVRVAQPEEHHLERLGIHVDFLEPRLELDHLALYRHSRRLEHHLRMVAAELHRELEQCA